jgi:hypothetical protein
VTATFVPLTVVAAVAIAVDPHRAPGALTPVLLLHGLAASSGFAAPARRGHYDLLFTHGSSRVALAVAHWIASVAPGLSSWLVLALVEVTASMGSERALLASGTGVAMTLVSTLPWAATVALPRFWGGIAWLVALATLSSTFSIRMTGAWQYVVNPQTAVGQALGVDAMLVVLLALAASLTSMAVACLWIARADVPLEAGQ